MSLPPQPEDTLNGFLDWDLLATTRLNAFICGDRATLAVTLRVLRPQLAIPVDEWSFVGEPHLPSATCGTLVVTDLDRAAPDRQRAFLEWLDRHDAVRVITVSERPVFGLVTSGELLEQLYYRLNPIYCALSPNRGLGSTGVDRSSAA